MKRALYYTLACLFLGGASLNFLCGSSALAASWPQRQRDSQNTGRADFTVPANRQGANFFAALRWQKRTPNSPNEGNLYASSMVFFDGVGPDAFLSAVGTGGTITGVGRALRKANPDVGIYALEPSESAVLSGGQKGPHKIQGIGTGFIPQVLDTAVFDGVFQVSSEEAFEMTRRLAKEEGILVGISSGAAVAGAIALAGQLGAGKSVVTIAPDNGERYLSTPVFQN